jgi:uncharacterized protein YigE (DUF2233 family)
MFRAFDAKRIAVLFAALVLVAVFAGGLFAEPAVVDTAVQDNPMIDRPAAKEPEMPVWRELQPGLWHSTIMVNGPEGFRVQAVKISLADFDVQAADARSFGTDIKAATVEDMARRESAVLAINGSFFDENQRPLGMVISRSFRINPYRQADWGILYIDEGSATLVHTKDWAQTHPKRVWFALQVGPRLVVNSQPTTLKPQLARRAAIGILPGRKHLVALVTDRGRAEAADLARLMAASPEQGGLGCIDAVAMDGGPSAQLYLKTESLELSVPGGWPVPIGVVFIPKVNRPVTP